MWQSVGYHLQGGKQRQLGAHPCPSPWMGHSPLLNVGLAAPWLSSLPWCPDVVGKTHTHRGSRPLTHLPWLSRAPRDFLNFNFSPIFLVSGFFLSSLCFALLHLSLPWEGGYSQQSPSEVPPGLGVLLSSFFSFSSVCKIAQKGENSSEMAC